MTTAAFAIAVGASSSRASSPLSRSPSTSAEESTGSSTGASLGPFPPAEDRQRRRRSRSAPGSATACRAARPSVRGLDVSRRHPRVRPRPGAPARTQGFSPSNSELPPYARRSLSGCSVHSANQRIRRVWRGQIAGSQTGVCEFNASRHVPISPPQLLSFVSACRSARPGVEATGPPDRESR